MNNKLQREEEETVMAVVVVLYLRSIAVTAREVRARNGNTGCLFGLRDPLEINITIDSESLIQDRWNESTGFPGSFFSLHSWYLFDELNQVRG